MKLSEGGRRIPPPPPQGLEFVKNKTIHFANLTAQVRKYNLVNALESCLISR